MKNAQLNGLKIFEVTARKLSMTKAADELFITHGAVSRQIKTLESALGVNLFTRKNRGIYLTAEGIELHKTCQDIFFQLNNTINNITQKEKSNSLVVSCEPTIAMRWLIPRLGDFQERHPEIVIHIFAAGGEVKFIEQGIDLAIRRNDFDINCFVEPLADEMVGPVCVPKLESTILTKAVRLHSKTRLNAWQKWCLQNNQISTEKNSNREFEHFYLSLEAASAGLGVAIASKFMVDKHLADGRLVAPYGFCKDGSSYCLLSATDFAFDENKLIFLKWLKKQFL
ncbi:LysR family transcriptional regulator [Colwellia sp. UCD-KL20]|uniref:LysR family transcriptional regulator n=1 Tax=Colwellia sp. UCD-KL20 TaxID=1917165 RepID=UPI000971378B|nr:LysR family transcriptional regulator [Colwellia sp. UCD-KL20]